MTKIPCLPLRASKYVFSCVGVLLRGAPTLAHLRLRAYRVRGTRNKKQGPLNNISNHRQRRDIRTEFYQGFASVTLLTIYKLDQRHAKGGGCIIIKDGQNRVLLTPIKLRVYIIIYITVTSIICVKICICKKVTIHNSDTSYHAVVAIFRDNI